MTVPAASSPLARLADFIVHGVPPAEARVVAATALSDTVGVILAGAAEPASRAVQRVIADEGGSGGTILGTSLRSSMANAALANGTAAHALDFDDMCFVSLAHPSAPLVPAILAAGETHAATGRVLLEAYIIGFEIEARLGRLMNPRHYQRGWHCTSTLGTIGAAAAVCRVAGLSAAQAGDALAIAASSAAGLKENFGSMVKPLHAGMAARNGVLAARLAQAGLTASATALDGAQGFLTAMDSEGADLAKAVADLGQRWEIVDTGITVKLYPSCAGTHPPLDAVLDLRSEHGFSGADIDRIDVGVDAITPTVLLYDRPASGLEAKFSLPYCVSAAVVHGAVGIETFDDAALRDERIRSLLPRVTMHVDASLDASAPALTRARVKVRLRDGRAFERVANGARGYPARPASPEQLAGKFLSCATRAIPSAAALELLALLRGLDDAQDIDRAIALAVTHAS